MRYYFTKRHENALKSKKFRPSLSSRLRNAIYRVLNDHSEWGGFDNAENLTFYNTEEKLKTFYGENRLSSYNEKSELVPTNLQGLIERGYPARVLDAIEAWFDCAEASMLFNCEKQLNFIFEIHNSHWRVVNSTLFLIDSEYLHNKIISKMQVLLHENSVTGVLEEFNEAVTCLTDGRAKDAIIDAHKSVESVMKTVLGIQDHLTFSKLLRKVIDSGIIPNYYEEFLTHFEKLALGAVKERNKPGAGHGQGAKVTEVSKDLAEFAVHLAAVINLFFIRRWIKTRPKSIEEPIIDLNDENEIPF